MRIAILASAVAAALLVVSGCGVQGEPPSAKRLAALTSHGIHVDYTPLASPATRSPRATWSRSARSPTSLTASS